MNNLLFLKTIFVFAFFSTILGVDKIHANEEIIDEIYYFINNDIITKLDFEEEKAALLNSDSPSLEGGEVNVFVMSNMIFDRLVVNNLKRNNSSISNTEVENEIKKIMSRQRITSLETFKAVLARSNIDYDNFFNNIKKRLNQRIFFSKGTDNAFPSEQAIQNHYEKNKDKYSIEEPIFNLSVIRIAILDGLGFSARRNFQRRLAEIRKKIEEEKIPFPTAVEQFNDFRNNVLTRDLGWVEIKSLGLPPRESSSLAALTPGDMSPIISTGEGLEIFLVNDKISEGYLPYQLAKKKSQEELSAQLRKKTISEKITALFKNAYLKSNHPDFASLAESIDNDS